MTKKNKIARLIFENFTTCEKSSRESTVDSLVAELRETGSTVKRAEVVALLQCLESLGCGKFMPGRHAKPSRMCWHFDRRNLGSIALGQGDELTSREFFASDEEAAAGQQKASAVLSDSQQTPYKTGSGSCPWDDILNERD